MAKRGSPKEMIKLTKTERSKLENLAASSGAGPVARRAEAILLCASGMTSTTVAQRVGLSEQSLCKWRKRYLGQRIDGLRDAPRTGRKRKDLAIPGDELAELVEWSKSRSLPGSIVNRAKIVLMAAEGRSNKDIAAAVGQSDSTVRKWKDRYRECGMEGLHDEYSKGRPRTYGDEEVARLLKKTLESKPEGATHWSCRTMAAETGISAATVSRIWNLFELKPHRRKGFKLSTDPFFVDKVVDICGLYLNPPDNAPP